MGDRDAWPSHLLRLACPAKLWHGVTVNLVPILPGANGQRWPYDHRGGRAEPFELMNRAGRNGAAAGDQKEEPIPPVVDSTADLDPLTAGSTSAVSAWPPLAAARTLVVTARASFPGG
jgi:hypothetical protein